MLGALGAHAVRHVVQAQWLDLEIAQQTALALGLQLLQRTATLDFVSLVKHFFYFPFQYFITITVQKEDVNSFPNMKI